MTKKQVSILVLTILLPALLVSCAKRPAEELQAADNAIAQARTAGVKEYAPDSLQAAEKAYSDMRTEAEAQDAKFALTRSYDRTVELASQVKTASDKAVADAARAKEQAKSDASAAIEQADSALAEAQTELASAPTGKGTKADIDAMKADLAGVESSIQDARAAFDREAYKEVMAKTQAAVQGAERVKGAVVMAKEMKAGKSLKRS